MDGTDLSGGAASLCGGSVQNVLEVEGSRKTVGGGDTRGILNSR